MEVDLRLIQSLGRWIIAGIYGIYNSVLVSIVSIDTEVEMKEETDVVVVEN